MSETRAIQVTFVIDENLCLVDEASKRGGMNNAIAVPLKFAAESRRGFVIASPSRLLVGGGVSGEIGWSGTHAAADRRLGVVTELWPRREKD